MHVIVYKEVTQALTRKYLSPTVLRYIHALLPPGIDAVTSAISKLGLAATLASLEHVEAENPLISPPVTVSSSHTKHALEALHPNISVFRHPDHLPDAQTLESSFLSSVKNLSITAATASKLPGDALKAIYGMNEDVILFWAHHEKLCLIDKKVAFMGGLDLCYGRWDTNQHPIADAHPSNLDAIVFPGQDFNNARIMDFSDVAHWEENKLDRTESPRMGWSDLSLSLRGPVVEDLKAHFVERWNFIYDEKYDVRKDTRYSRLSAQRGDQNMIPHHVRTSETNRPIDKFEANFTPGYGSGEELYFPPPPVTDRGVHEGLESNGGNEPSNGTGKPQEHHQHHIRQLGKLAGSAAVNLIDRVDDHMHQVEDQYVSELDAVALGEGIACQIVRSCTQWSHGVKTEHSIANAYIGIIHDSQHFVYIENQFFITATTHAQKPVMNKIGAALVERILRAARAGERYKVVVVMPAIPAFAGDLKDESSLGTRAIMDYQYNSINRGGNSIMESIQREGYDPTEYIRFYNLRSYDRLNVSASMRDVEQASNVNYEVARREHDNIVDPVGYRAQGGPSSSGEYTDAQNYREYQQAAARLGSRDGLGNGRWDTVSECYMLGGCDIREVPWESGNVPEIDTFVSEELYIHSKVLIADDRTVICGSANLNDRSQLGYHDSEIAVVLEDPVGIDSCMNGKPWTAARFAATLRRQLCRKHLGLLPPQDMERPDQNFEPLDVPNIYEFGTAEDRAVKDPLSDQFLGLWNGRARQNTEAFGRIFHPVPHDNIRTWKDYDVFYEHFFKETGGKDGGKKPAKYKWGHVVAENFAPGEEGLREMKDLLSTIKGTLVEMPLLFLIHEDIARVGLTLNAFTEEVYT